MRSHSRTTGDFLRRSVSWRRAVAESVATSLTGRQIFVSVLLLKCETVVTWKSPREDWEGRGMVARRTKVTKKL